ncbi:MAG: HAMP domain-containing histidine kinase, partial [Candidatus Omnitrophica bacterium]|nr:HAMP domain-containing histidine kinase [Candidatus Omnitrophota bacterium]
KKIKDGEPIYKSIIFEKRNLRIIAIPFLQGDTYYIIQIATSLKPVIHLLQVRLLHIVISIPIILLGASFLGGLFAARILRPVVEITKTASKITHEDLSARVKAEHVDEEMRYLVQSFNDMISRLEQTFNYISEFSSHVAHDLKTPLAIIRGEADVVLRKERGKEEYKRVIMVILEETQSMSKVIDDLLLLTRLDYRPEFFKFERFDIIEFLTEIFEQSKLLASRRGITVEVSFPKAEITVNADRVHLRRLFFNILDNAIKFSRESSSIVITATQKDNKVCVAIEDSGVGIVEQDLPKIFDRYFRAQSSDLQEVSGTGLGLHIAQSIAKVHQGIIQVQSTPEKGSVFTVILPLA